MFIFSLFLSHLIRARNRRRRPGARCQRPQLSSHQTRISPSRTCWPSTGLSSSSSGRNERLPRRAARARPGWNRGRSSGTCERRPGEAPRPTRSCLPCPTRRRRWRARRGPGRTACSYTVSMGGSRSPTLRHSAMDSAPFSYSRPQVGGGYPQNIPFLI